MATLSGCRHGFESLPASKAEFHNHYAAVGEGGGVKIADLDNAHDLELAKNNLVRSHSASSGGDGCGEGAVSGFAGKGGCKAIGNGGCNGSSAQTRAEEQLPLAGRSSLSYSGTPDLEGRELRSNVHDGTRGSARSGGVDIRQDGNFDAGSGESRQEGKGRKKAFLRECLLPMKLLEEKGVRTILFVYALFSVRSHLFSVRCTR